MSTLVIVPCGKAKIWDRYPHAGPTLAAQAYVGAPFKVNTEYARSTGDAWMILSAKYGFLLPSDLISGPYNVSFKHPRTAPITVPALRQQVDVKRLRAFDIVIGLGGKEYRDVLRRSFAPKEIDFPFEGMDLFGAISATKQAGQRRR